MTIFSQPRWLAMCVLSVVACAGALPLPSMAGEWPQILGPSRNGIAADDEKLADRWPQSGPKVVWRRKAGSGYAGVAVSGGRVVLFHRLEDEEVAECLDAATGKPLWKASFPTTFRSE